MKRVALYPGTFDPVTRGHYWIIDEATDIFDKVIVAVADNPDKRGKTMFSIDERVKMVEETCWALKGIVCNPGGLEVVAYAGEANPQFTVKFAESVGATHLIRGIRNEADFGTEQAIRNINQDIGSKIKTVFLIPPRHFSEVSSSMVKGLVGFVGWREVIGRYVDDCVVKRFQAERLGADEVMMRLGVPEDVALQARSFLEGAYASPDRFYHDQTHIRRCLELLKLTVSDRHISSEAFDEMAAALWFHDCVYDIMASNNEIRSADEFERLADQVIANIDIEAIRRMIEGTKSHAFCGEHKNNVVSDIDMAGLGLDEYNFDKNESNIRLEYRSIPDAQFYPGRKKLVQEWLDSGVYHTQMFHTLFNKQMTENLQKLLARPSYVNAEG